MLGLRVLHPVLGSSAQQGLRPAGAQPEEVTKILRGMKHLFPMRRAKRIGIVQCGEQKAWE